MNEPFVSIYYVGSNNDVECFWAPVSADAQSMVRDRENFRNSERYRAYSPKIVFEVMRKKARQAVPGDFQALSWKGFLYCY
ncbi:MAG: hypothetical protein ABI758_00315 [Candidatus Woesebacteria bacterium]